MTDEEEKNKKIKESMDKLSKTNTLMIMNPVDIEKMKKKGFPIVERFITNTEYIEKLYSKKKPLGLFLLGKLLPLDKSIANAVIYQIYEQLRESLATENLTSVIVNSILLLEFSMRLKLYMEYKKDDPNYPWIELEKHDFSQLVARLVRKKVLNNKERIVFNTFSDDKRNPYFHMNVYKMSIGKIIQELDALNMNTGEIEKKKDVKIIDHHSLWFAGKVIFDGENFIPIMDFCIKWTNTLLK